LLQDHAAHIAAHQAFMQDPEVMQTIGQNPQANVIMAALQAHISEHMGYKFRAQVEQQMGVALPMPDQKLPPEVEQQLSRLIAQASQQVLQASKANAAQAQAQQQLQDPIVQMEQQKLQIQQAELQLEQQKQQAEQQFRQAEIQAALLKINNQKEVDMARIQAEIAHNHGKAAQDEQKLRLELAVDAAKTAAKIEADKQKNA